MVMVLVFVVKVVNMKADVDGAVVVMVVVEMMVVNMKVEMDGAVVVMVETIAAYFQFRDT